MTFGQCLDGPGHHAGAAQQRLPTEHGNGLLRVPAGRCTSQIDPDHRPADRLQGGRSDRRPDPDARLADIDQPLPGSQRPGQPHRLFTGERHRIGEQTHQRRISGIVAQ